MSGQEHPHTDTSEPPGNRGNVENVLYDGGLRTISNCIRTMNLAAGGHSAPDTLLNHAEQLKELEEQLVAALGALATQNSR